MPALQPDAPTESIEATEYVMNDKVQKGKNFDTEELQVYGEKET